MNGKITRFLALALSLSTVPALAYAAPVKPAAAAKPSTGSSGGLSLLQRPPSLSTRLKLTAEQTAKLEAIQAKLQSEMKALYGQNQQLLPAKFQQITRSREQADADAMAVLTPAQRKEFDAANRDYMAIDSLGSAALRLISVPTLTTEQKAKLKTLAHETTAKRTEVAMGLAKPGTDQKEIGQKLQLLESEVQQSVKSLLTESQLTLFNNAFNAVPVKSGEKGKPAPAKDTEKPAASKK